MTENRDFKQLIRERMRATGESYSTAKRHLEMERQRSPAEVLDWIFEVPGRRLRLTGRTQDPKALALAQRYWAAHPDGSWKEKVATIAASVQLATHELVPMVKEAVEVRSTRHLCKDCGEGQEFRTRSDMLSRSRWRGRCEACQSAERRRQEAKRARALEEAERTRQKPLGVKPQRAFHLEGLSLREAAALLALLLSSEDDQLEVMGPARDTIPPFAPTTKLQEQLLTELWKAGWISVHPSSSKTAVRLLPDGRVGIEIPGACWRPCFGETPEERFGVMTRLKSALSGREWQDGWIDQVEELWWEVAVHDAIDYFRYRLEEHGIEELRWGQGTAVNVAEALKHFVPGQVYSFLYGLARDAAADASRPKISRRQATNWAIKRLARRPHQARREAWNVKTFSRPWQLESHLWTVLCDYVLEIDGLATLPGDRQVLEALATRTGARLASVEEVDDAPPSDSPIDVNLEEPETASSTAPRVERDPRDKTSGIPSERGFEMAEVITRQVALAFELPVGAIHSPSHRHQIAQPRQIAMYLCQQLTGLSYSDLGRYFGRHHSTVVYSVEKVSGLLRSDRELASRVRKISLEIDDALLEE